MTKLIPKYTVWEAVQAALSVGMKALEEVRHMAAEVRAIGSRPVFTLEGIDFEYDGERTFTIVGRHGGQETRKSFEVAIPLYRGIHDKEKSYTLGDCVTHDGSTWVAKEKTTSRPGTDATWQLMVKKGRDGREVVSIPRDPSKPVKI